MACCSIRVKHPEDAFKPEYIVPQLLLQWIRQSKYDGICYFSTRIDNITDENLELFRNYAFPVKDRLAQGICQRLANKFKIRTNAIPWQLFQLHKESSGILASEVRNHPLEIVKGVQPIPYSRTDFRLFEELLISSYA